MLLRTILFLSVAGGLCVATLACRDANAPAGTQAASPQDAVMDPLAGLASNLEVVTTPSGLKYVVIRKGEDGPRPSLGDKVKVNYTGKLADGTVFDSTDRRGAPAELGVAQVIPGWTEGLQLMTKGAKFRFIIPYALAYGKKGSPPRIPPKADLMFDVELVSFEKGVDLPPFHEGNPAAQKSGPSGLIFEALREGAGAPPKLADEVTVNFAIWTTGGQLVDCSELRGGPMKYMLGDYPERIFNEGVALLSPGARYRFVVPPELAWGDQGMGAKIPPNTTLIFELELVGIQPGPELPKFHQGNPEAQKRTESGLVYEVLTAGTGEKPQPGDMVKLSFAFWLENGKLIDCTEKRGRAWRVRAGDARGIKLIDEASLLLDVGSRMRFIVPPELAFGATGSGALVPPNATLIWEIELEKILRPLPVPEFSAPLPESLTATNTGLKYQVVTEGTGASPKSGEIVQVQYVGWLEDGTVVDNSYGSGEPAAFQVGRAIPGWNEGLQLMKEGATFKFVIPPYLGYGSRGNPPRIPPDATLIFQVEMIKVGK